jgi:hypothetical protein
MAEITVAAPVTISPPAYTPSLVVLPVSSSATTAKPIPISPAGMVTNATLKAYRFVCSGILEITSIISYF